MYFILLFKKYITNLYRDNVPTVIINNIIVHFANINLQSTVLDTHRHYGR